MAHASSLEKSKLMMKKYRAGKKKRQLAENLMPEEDKARRDAARREPPSVSTQLNLMIHDFEHLQLADYLRPKLLTLCHERLKEIDATKTHIPNRHQILRINETLKKLEVEPNGRKRI